jgi:Cys-rich protein (TIGR01571 family)
MADAYKYLSQPTPDYGFAMLIFAPDARPVPTDIGVGEWDEGVWGCCFNCMSNFCMSTICPWVSMAQISVCLGHAFYFVCLILSFFFSWPLLWPLCSEARKHFQIPRSSCVDCCAVVFCGCCTIAQLATHVKSFKPGNCAFGPPDTITGSIEADNVAFKTETLVTSSRC